MDDDHWERDRRLAIAYEQEPRRSIRRRSALSPLGSLRQRFAPDLTRCHVCAVPASCLGTALDANEYGYCALHRPASWRSL